DSLHALRRAVDEARLRDAVLYSVIAWTPPGGDTLDRRVPEPHLRRIWVSAALRTLRAAWDEAMGGVPSDVHVFLRAERGQPGWVLTGLAALGTDLIVVGAGRGGALRRVGRHSVPRYCTTKAACGVLVVPAPPLARQFEHGVLPGLRQRKAVQELLDDGHIA
ncbi:MAG TPA: universal stress protein, partial [Pseudonocardiaceae bacterium]|nr:universal stress protein [Pseudonocardiaceae bacterium]